MSILYGNPHQLAGSNPKAGTTERALSVAAGALLVLPLLEKRSALRWTAAAAGAALIYCGVSGSRGASRVLGAKHSLHPTQHLRESITIGKTASELHALWRDLDVLTKVMQPFGQVEPIGTAHLRWTLNLPVGKLQAEAILVEDRPDELVHWRTAPRSRLLVDEYMRLQPAPQGLGTEMTLEYYIDFSQVPAGDLLSSILSFFEQAPKSAIRKILHNFKSLAESGEIPTLERNPSGRARKNTGKGDLL